MNTDGTCCIVLDTLGSVFKSSLSRWFSRSRHWPSTLMSSLVPTPHVVEGEEIAANRPLTFTSMPQHTHVYGMCTHTHYSQEALYTAKVLFTGEWKAESHRDDL